MYLENMNINFILTLTLFVFIFIISLEGRTIHYCIKRIGGRQVYVWNEHPNMQFSSYREMMDFALYGARPTTRRPTTTLVPLPKIKIDTKKYNKLFLAQTNKRRKLHGVPALTFNQQIADAAQKWAEECARDNKAKYDYDNTYTTNYQGFSIQEYKNAIKHWYNEESVHNYTKNYFTNASRHFALLIWKPFKEMGCGFAQGAREVFVVCKYSPPQKSEGGYIENVPKPKSRRI
uniref:CAP domain-containing protein (inferred by orthology to a human protein) n=1 Tax=Strongyloides venezuelensis TaxID=75913 RepID=A0A0K0FZR7_STRVS